MTTLQWFQTIAVVAALIGSALAIGRVVFVTEVKVERLEKDVAKVEGKADSTDKEVTGPHNMRAVKLAGDIANVDEKLSALASEFRDFRAEYRQDQHRGKRS